MKVQCIERPPQAWETDKPPVVEIGKVYTVIHREDNQTTDKQHLKAWYELAEDPGMCYSQKLFIPLSSIDETTFVREYQTQSA